MARADTVRRRYEVCGIVQGVGFRPFVYSLAAELGLGGFVLNDSHGVVIEVEGEPASVDDFGARLRRWPPALAVIESIEEHRVDAIGDRSFQIRTSDRSDVARTGISPDIATCAECVGEIFDPANRRYRYAFTNCTNCGPRFTIATGIPYDRERTTMAGFRMCGACRAEYEDPRDRRFHAQPIACPACGPRLRATDGTGDELDGDAIEVAAAALARGDIVAVKGIGGYHLACNAGNDDAVACLRTRKAREEKPLAVMAPDLGWVERLAHLTAAQRRELTSPRAPIVLLDRRDDAPVAPSVAPSNRVLGVMVPYSPLHHLLMSEIRHPLVLTSGNVSDEPIAYRDDDAFERLGDIADAFLTHDRPIHIRCDDSVVTTTAKRPMVLRRARGYAPQPVLVDPPFDEPVFATGPHLKATFCLGIGDRAFVSQHIGDLDDYDARSSYDSAATHFMAIYECRPEVFAHDVHPEYATTKWAAQRAGESIGVQHHHAHIASCLADNRRNERVIGLALDGTGFGDDGAVWGCEVLAADLGAHERLGHLRYVPLPGGDAAARQPWRMGAVYLTLAFGPDAGDLDLDFVRRTAARWAAIVMMAERGLNAPPTSSAGRLFDAAAALCGVRDEMTYEGQAAAELEQLADPSVVDGYPCSLRGSEIDGVELIAALADDLAGGAPPPVGAARFHNGLATGLVASCRAARSETGLGTVALSGGTFQNRLLVGRVEERLERDGFEVLTHGRVPPNDGGISLGQAVVAAARRRR